MNERLANNKIYLLAKEAGLIEFEQLDWNPELVSPTYESVAKSRKFAELIVQECANFIDSHEQVDKYGESMDIVYGKDLLKHFGVEQ